MLRILSFAAALLALPPILDGARAASPGPVSRVADLQHADIKRSNWTATTSSFLYTVMPTEQEIGLIHYGEPPFVEPEFPAGRPDEIDWSRARLQNCATTLLFQKECEVARKREYQWFKGDALGARIWYSRDLKGNPVCYSTDGEHCLPTTVANPANSTIVDAQATLDTLGAEAGLKTLFGTRDNVRVTTRNGLWIRRIVLPFAVKEGSIFHLTVKSTQPVEISVGQSTAARWTVAAGSRYAWVFSAGNWHTPEFDPNDTFNKLVAKPIRCGDAHAGPKLGPLPRYSWCAQLRGVANAFDRQNLQGAIDNKIVHMDNLFDQHKDWSAAKVDADHGYVAKLSSLATRIRATTQAQQWACIFAWLPPGAIACGVLGSEADSLIRERVALVQERSAKLAAASTAIETKRSQQWHELHKTWAAGDQTHFAALLKAESKELDELKQLKREYDKTAEQQHQAYLDAVDAANRAISPVGLLENLPLIGPQIKHIAEYTENPSSKNLRRMLLGLVGPIGEAAEGAVELTTGDSGLDSGQTRFLTDALKDLTDDGDLKTKLEEIVSDAINDLGDEAIESVREAGLWVDRPGKADPPLKIAHRSIVDLKAGSRAASFDPWTAGGEHARLFRNKFTPRLPGMTAYLAQHRGFTGESMTTIELASGGAAFEHALEGIFSHSMGKDYHRVVDHSANYLTWSKAQVTAELYKVIAGPAYAEQRKAYWVTSAVIGQRPAGLLYDNDHALIVLNSDLIDASEDWSKFYFEELGHLLNWWRCDLFDVEPGLCAVHGDEGARFRDAVLLDPTLHDGSYEALLAELPAHPEVDKVAVAFADDKLGWLEGWPHYYTMQDHIRDNAKFSFLMRLGLDVDSQEYPGVSDEFDLEFVIGAPAPTMKGDPWKVSANGYCTSDTQTDCNMPTMWAAISFRDALKYSLAKMPQLKTTAGAAYGLDLSPRLVRKHGGKLPFQLTSVNGASWRYYTDKSIYFKKFTAAAEAKLDFWKLGHAAAKAQAPTLHKPELSLKSTPLEGSYVVEIATADRQDFDAWLAADVTSALLGCAGGFVAGLMTEQDPVTLCHLGSDVLEGIETTFQLLDKKPTVLVEADGSVTLPISTEYKYATSGKKLFGGRPAAASTGRAVYHADAVEADFEAPAVDPDAAAAGFGSQPYPTASTATNPQVSNIKTKLRSGLGKLPVRGVSPLAVFRFRVGIDYGEKIVRRGENNLPSAIVQE